MSRPRNIDAIAHLIDIEKLRGMGYFEVPASISHHSNFAGGLYHHSSNVADILRAFTENNRLIWQRPESPEVIGCLHDLAKTMECIKDEPDEWSAAHGYRRSPFPLPAQHEPLSVMIAASLLRLTPEEVACIAYHHGAFRDKAQWDGYNNAAKTFPNVLWVHHADMIATNVLEKED